MSESGDRKVHSVISRRVDAEGVCVLCFDDPERSANVLDADVLGELAGHLDAIVADGAAVTGVMVTSARPEIFIAGADLRKLETKVTGGWRLTTAPPVSACRKPSSVCCRRGVVQRACPRLSACPRHWR
jgi:enoyl-CoA hydratase/carnithine racemase